MNYGNSLYPEASLAFGDSFVVPPEYTTKGLSDALHRLRKNE